MPSSAGIAEPQPVPQAPSDLPGPSAQDLPAQPGSFHITARYGAATEELTLPQQDPSLSTVVDCICAQFSLDRETIKLMGVGKGLLQAKNVDSAATASTAGLKNGARIVVMGSKAAELAAVRQAEVAAASARLPSFEHEARVAAQRRRRARDVQPPPFGTKYTFQSYQVLERPGLQPPAEEARKLLYRLASDPGIVSVMAKHQFTVGMLAEMPPEGMVGVDPVCVLGYNTNKGQSIHLRLRTDDLRGFRKYESIRMTLCHELTHNVWGDHDNNFKALCSQLNREVDEVHTRLKHTARFASWTPDAPASAPDDTDMQDSSVAGKHPALTASAASSGKTLRQLAKESRAAVSAAPALSSTLQHSASSAISPRSNAVQGSGAVAGSQVSAPQAQQQGQVHGAGGSDGGNGEQDDVATMYTHFDAQTDELEKRQRALEQ